MSQFKKYLGIVTEGKDYLYSEESESIEEYVSAAGKLIKSTEKNLDNTSDEKRSDTEKMVNALETLNTGLTKQEISEEEKEMVIKLLGDILDKCGKSQMLSNSMSKIKTTLGIYKI